MKPLIIYHGDCPDGFGAAWWLGKYLGDHEKFAASYNERVMPPDCTDRQVYMVDFCYNGLRLAQVLDQCSELLILDHHKTAFGYVEEQPTIVTYGKVTDLLEGAVVNLSRKTRHRAVLDMEHSGVGLVSQYVAALVGKEPPEFLWHLEDRDLWNWQNKPTPGKSEDTPAVFAAVTSFPYAESDWDWMSIQYIESLVSIGEGIERYRQKLIENIMDTAYLTNLFGHEVWCVSAPYAVGSDVAGALALRDPERPFAAYYVDYGDRLKYGLRSRGEGGADVSLLAATAGGGGHKNASGFEVIKPGKEAL